VEVIGMEEERRREEVERKWERKEMEIRERLRKVMEEEERWWREWRRRGVVVKVSGVDVEMVVGSGEMVMEMVGCGEIVVEVVMERKRGGEE